MFAFLNHWSNAPFLVMLGLVAVIVFLQAAGLMGLVAEGGSDHEVNVDADHDVDLNHDVDADGDADADQDADSDADADGWHGALSYFGVGRVPLMVLAVTWLLFTGFSGILFNSFAYVRFGGTFVYPGWVLPVTYGTSLAVGLVATRLFSRVLGRIFDLGTRGATAKHELSGRIGVVASPELGSKFGEIRVRDERGNELLVHARIETGEDPLKLGEEVVLVDYDTESEMFLATSAAFEIRPGPKRPAGGEMGPRKGLDGERKGRK
ncbi:YqiJ family protein [Pendulispora rubella]|uniref:YqiJ family protein n=1 Tax=Pendulispora rubella TaxID=2741070 RepID=A0ABZ2LBD5_9BACT